MSLKISDIVFLAALLTKRLQFDKPKLVSQYVQNRRILPDDTPKPGPWDNAHTPYLVEFMDNMSPYSPIQKQVVLKGCQLGFTAAIENIVLFFIGAHPSPILYVTADEELAKAWSSERLDPAIDSMDMRDLMQANSTEKKTKASGDKILQKTFKGGSIKMLSAKSPSKLRFASIRVLLIDEADGSNKNLTTGEGGYLGTAEARTSAFDETKKITIIGTPKPMNESLIWEEYLLGDQRKFFVPCPHCGTMQELVLAKNDNETGLKATLNEDGSFKEAYYSCIKCDDKIYNYHKPYMKARGEWRPTSKCLDPTLRSYQISSLYSPVGFLGWDSFYKKYLKAIEGEDAEGMREFTPLYLGMPYKETGTRPKQKNLSEYTGTYKSGTIPDGVLFLTMAVDVQTGSKKDKSNPERLEIEICGHGMGYRTWSIQYRIFEGSVDDAFDGAWQDLYNFIEETQLEFEAKNGVIIQVQKIFVDSGNGTSMTTVYQFCELFEQANPIKGFGVLKAKGGDGESNTRMYDKWRRKKVDDMNILIEISTRFYKKQIYTNLKKQRSETGNNPPGFCDFPIDYGEKYFKGLTSEELKADGSFDAGGRRNEPLDLRVYNICAAGVLLSESLAFLRAKAVSAGWDKIHVAQLGLPEVFERMRINIEEST